MPNSNATIEIDCAALRSKLDLAEPLTLIDCREPAEHELVAIEGSTLIPMNDTPARIDEYRSLPAPVVVYCHHGSRSLQVVNWLRSHGVEQVQSLRGGIDEWSLSVDRNLPRY